MGKTVDCGDLTLSVNLSIGIRFQKAVRSEDDIDNRKRLSVRLDQFKGLQNTDDLEQHLLDALVEHMGFTPESIKEKIEKREADRQAAIDAEVEGRKKKQQRRSGARV